MKNMKKTLLTLMIMSTTFSSMVWAEQSTTQNKPQQVKPTNSTAQQKPKPATNAQQPAKPKNNTQQQKVNTTAQAKPKSNTQQAKPTNSTQQTKQQKPNTTTQAKPTAQQQVKPRTTTPQQKPTPSPIKPRVNVQQQPKPTQPITAQAKPTPPVQLAKPVNNPSQTKPMTTAVVATTAAAATAATVVAAAQSNTASEQAAPTESTNTTQAPLYNPAMAVVPNVAGAPKSDASKTTTDTKIDKTKLTATQVVVSKEAYDRYQSLEQRNDETVAQNQELQMHNDNLSTQVKVLESERTAQLLFYGAMILLVGSIFGFLTGYLFARRQRPYL